MGYMNAVSMADATRDDRAAGIAWNLQANHYPPLPVAYVEPVLAALDAVESEDYGALIDLPTGLNPLPRTAAYDEDREVWTVDAATLVQITHSEPFLREDEDD